MSLLAEASFLFGWSPDKVLTMQAALFFAMIKDGKAIKHRNKMRDLYELCRVSTYPHYTKESQEELLQYYWDNSQTEMDRDTVRALRDKIEEESKEQIAKSAAPNRAVLDFFKSANRSALNG